jgi:hypothetical protein
MHGTYLDINKNMRAYPVYTSARAQYCSRYGATEADHVLTDGIQLRQKGSSPSAMINDVNLRGRERGGKYKKRMHAHCGG